MGVFRCVVETLRFGVLGTQSSSILVAMLLEMLANMQLSST